MIMWQRLNLIGKRFGMLEVIAFAGMDKHGASTWECVCDCGKTKVMMANSLQRGLSKSCGCSRVKDMTGQRIGNLTVIEQAGTIKRTNSAPAKWKCRCDCGNITIVEGTSLRRGSTKSCGCASRVYKKQGISGYDGVRLSNYKNGARSRDIPIELTDQEALNLMHKPCYICGKEPPTHGLNGIDRLDNSLGYTTTNSYPCCKKCNNLKGGITMDMLQKLAEVIS